MNEGKTDSKVVKFNQEKNPDFAKLLKEKVDEYFSKHGFSKKANAAMFLKMVLIMLLFIVSYSAILSNRFSEAALLAWAIVFGFSKVLIAFNIGHDASHNALFRNPKLNLLLSYSFNFIGVNRYIWHIKHNLSHHTFTNIPGHDMDIEQTKIARLVPSAPLKWYHRYQHIYVPLLYPVASLFIVFVKDFQMFATKKYGNSYQNNYPKKEYRIMLASKLFYIFYSLVIPLIVIHLPWWKILIGYLIMHSVLGIFMAVILFPVHVLDDVPFPQADSSGHINNSWIVHQIETSTNFGSRNWFLFHLCGGLNIHIPHHLFPGICHIHYFGLNKIIRSVALENGLRYIENTVAGAMLSHLRYLKQMGRS